MFRNKDSGLDIHIFQLGYETKKFNDLGCHADYIRDIARSFKQLWVCAYALGGRGRL